MSIQRGLVGGWGTRSLLAAALGLVSMPVAAQSQFNARPTINVTGFGNVPTEGTSSRAYVANVIQAENGLASFEALKAQAVAARTFAYFKMQGQGFIDNGTNDQVYEINGNAPGSIHFAAAQATEGEILWVRDNIGTPADVLIAAFYVAGSIPSASRPFDFDNPGIIVTPANPDATNTERFVTYTYANGLFGGNNIGTTLGFQGTPNNPNWPNRGAHSQNGADYLSDNSVNYLDILKYYYGSDIQIRTVETAGTGVSLGRKVLTDFDNYGSGRASDGIINGHEGVFNRDIDLTKNASANVTAADAVRTNQFIFDGTHAQRLDVTLDPASDDDWFVRHVAGARYAEATVVGRGGVVVGTESLEGEPMANLQFNATGSVGVYLRTTTPGLSASLAVDDGGVGVANATGGGDRGRARELIADGNWHRYEWFLEEAGFWEAGELGADGILDADRVSLDSLQIFGNAGLSGGASAASVWIDEFFWDPSAVFTMLAGDYNGSGSVEQGDLDLVLNNWGQDTALTGTPNGWLFGVPTGLVGQGALDEVLNHWGSVAAPNFAGVVVPEPAAAFALMGLIGLTFRRKNR